MGNSLSVVPSVVCFCLTRNARRRSHLFIDGTQLVNNGGLHGAQQACGAVTLAEGGHNVKVKCT